MTTTTTATTTPAPGQAGSSCSRCCCAGWSSRWGMARAYSVMHASASSGRPQGAKMDDWLPTPAPHIIRSVPSLLNLAMLMSFGWIDLHSQIARLIRRQRNSGEILHTLFRQNCLFTSIVPNGKARARHTKDVENRFTSSRPATKVQRTRAWLSEPLGPPTQPQRSLAHLAHTYTRTHSHPCDESLHMPWTGNLRCVHPTPKTASTSTHIQ